MPSAKRRLQGVVQGTFTGLWTVGFRALHHFRPRAVPSWRPAEGACLVVAPHPDDEVAGCAGTILAHRAAGEPTTVACLSDGRRSRALGLEPEAMATRRRTEASAAAKILDSDLDWIGLPEGDWTIDEAAARLTATLDRCQPKRIYAPSRLDFHAEHRRSARALARALAQTDSRAEVWIYPVHVPLTTPLVGATLSVDADESTIVRATHAHSSQSGSLWRCLRMRRYAGARFGKGGLAETFWPLSASRYIHLHQATDSALTYSPEAAFFGMRYYAWSDPLAYLRGRHARDDARGSLT